MEWSEALPIKSNRLITLALCRKINYIKYTNLPILNKLSLGNVPLANYRFSELFH
jgi:hypothetical protein